MNVACLVDVSWLGPGTRSGPAFFYPAANVLALFLQLHSFAAEPDQFLLAIFQLLPKPLRIALGIGLSLAGSLEHLYSAINFLLQRLEIVGWNLFRYLFHCI